MWRDLYEQQGLRQWIECASCRERGHAVSSCPLLHYSPEREAVLQAQNCSSGQGRSGFIRKYKTYFHSYLDHFIIRLKAREQRVHFFQELVPELQPVIARACEQFMDCENDQDFALQFAIALGNAGQLAPLPASGRSGLPQRLASNAARIASPMPVVVTGVPPSGPIRSAVRTPSASTFSTAASTRAASSPIPNE